MSIMELAKSWPDVDIHERPIGMPEIVSLLERGKVSFLFSLKIICRSRIYMHTKSQNIYIYMHIRRKIFLVSKTEWQIKTLFVNFYDWGRRMM